MKKTLTLSRVLIKNNSTSLSSDKIKESKSKNILKKIAIVASFLYLTIIIFFTSRHFIESMIQTGQSLNLFSSIFGGINIYLFIIAMMIIPNVFYFSNDLERLIPLPLSHKDIINAKLITSYFSLILLSAFFTIPIYSIYVYYSGFNILETIIFMLISFSLPLIPLGISLIIISLLFYFLPKANNKDVFTLVSSLFMIALILYIQFSMQSEQIALLPNVNFIFYTKYLAQSIVQENILIVSIYLLSVVLLLFMTVFIAEKFYLKSVQSAQIQTKSKKKIKIKKNIKKRNKIHAFMAYDFKNILRTPAFFINYFLSLILMPFIFLFSIYAGIKSEGGTMEIASLIQFGQMFIHDFYYYDIIALNFLLSFSLTFFISSITSISSTAISREGETIKYFKSLPFELIDMIKAKTYLSAIITSIIPITLILLLNIALSMPLYIYPINLIFILVTSLFSAYFNMIIDVFKPKLIWDNETQAVKNNFLVVITLFTSFGLLALFIYSFFNFDSFIVTVIAFIIMIISTRLIKKLLERKGIKSLNREIEKI